MFLPIFVSFNKNVISPNIEVIILNEDTINDGDYINILIKNNTKNKYCLLLDTTALKIKTPYYSDNTIMLNPIFEILDENKKNQPISLDDVNCDSIVSVFEHNNKLNFKKTIKNLIKINAKSKTFLKIKFEGNVQYSSYCWRNYKNDNSKKFFLRANLMYYDEFLNSESLDSLKKLGYKMYKKNLTSNIVPFKFKD